MVGIPDRMDSWRLIKPTGHSIETITNLINVCMCAEFSLRLTFITTLSQDLGEKLTYPPLHTTIYQKEPELFMKELG